jgi:glycerol uptake facilitator-like aquaporin
MRDIVMYSALVGQAIGAIGGVVVVVLMFRRRAKERRERAEREAGQSLTPPAAPGPDRPDWHGAPAGKPR